MALTVKPAQSKSDWEAFLAKHSEANFLQSWYWGDFHELLGHKVVRLVFYDEKKIIGVSLAVVENARRGRYMTIAGGPILDWDNNRLVKLWRDSIFDSAKKMGCAFVRVRPQLLGNDYSKHVFHQLGFRSAPMHLSAELTSQLDLIKSDDELMSAMRQQTRYEIRKAIKLGISIEESTDPKQLKAFYELQLETARRQGFVPFSYEFLEKQFEVFAKADAVRLYTAKHEGKILAQAFVIFYGTEAAYHYGVSTELGRKYPGAYLIQWHAILQAKKLGLSRYNFWGVAPVDQPKHRFHGVSVFKRGFGGADVEYLHAHDLVINPAQYGFNLAVETLRKHLRRV